MNIRNLKSGMLVKICNDPAFSISKHGGLDGYKKTLGGTIQTIRRVYYGEERVYIQPPRSCTHDNISFHITDLTYPDERELEEDRQSPSDIKPELFDPKQLVIENTPG